MEKLLSVAEAADSLGVHRTRVNQLIDGGALPAIRIGKAYAIQESDLELVRERAPRGRPSKKRTADGEVSTATDAPDDGAPSPVVGKPVEVTGKKPAKKARKKGSE
jgi:excisionase family DNA binding protein